MNDDPNEFLNMCKHFEIFPDVWALKNWSHWMTPASNKTHRFSAVFFIATTHQMPNVHGDDKEIQDLMVRRNAVGKICNNKLYVLCFSGPRLMNAYR